MSTTLVRANDTEAPDHDATMRSIGAAVFTAMHARRGAADMTKCKREALDLAVTLGAAAAHMMKRGETGTACSLHAEKDILVREAQDYDRWARADRRAMRDALKRAMNLAEDAAL